MCTNKIKTVGKIYTVKELLYKNPIKSKKLGYFIVK